MQWNLEFDLVFILKKGDFAKIQMLLKSKAVLLLHKGQATLHNLWFMRPNMKSLKASDLHGGTL